MSSERFVANNHHYYQSISRPCYYNPLTIGIDQKSAPFLGIDRFYSPPSSANDGGASVTALANGLPPSTSDISSSSTLEHPHQAVGSPTFSSPSRAPLMLSPLTSPSDRTAAYRPSTADRDYQYQLAAAAAAVRLNNSAAACSLTDALSALRNASLVRGHHMDPSIRLQSPIQITDHDAITTTALCSPQAVPASAPVGAALPAVSHHSHGHHPCSIPSSQQPVPAGSSQLHLSSPPPPTSNTSNGTIQNGYLNPEISTAEKIISEIVGEIRHEAESTPKCAGAAPSSSYAPQPTATSHLPSPDCSTRMSTGVSHHPSSTVAATPAPSSNQHLILPPPALPLVLTKSGRKRGRPSRDSSPGAKPFTCTYCPKGFYQKNQLIQHERIHTDERPYPCTFCDRRFKQQSHKMQHERIHTGEKPYLCPICSRNFRQKNHLDSHYRSHFATAAATPGPSSDLGRGQHFSMVNMRGSQSGSVGGMSDYHHGRLMIKLEPPGTPPSPSEDPVGMESQSLGPVTDEHSLYRHHHHHHHHEPAIITTTAAHESGSCDGTIGSSTDGLPLGSSATPDLQPTLSVQQMTCPPEPATTAPMGC